MRFRAVLCTFASTISIFFASSAFAQGAKHIVISQVSPMHGNSSQYDTGEFIELYNPLSTDVTFGPNLQIVSGNTSATYVAEWQLSLSGKKIKAFGFFLVGDRGVTPTPDMLFPSSKNLSNSGTRSCVQLRDGTTVVDAFGWDPSGTTLSPEGTAFAPSSTLSDGKSFERKSGPAATADDSLGNAWDSDNNPIDFFEISAAKTIVHNSSSPIEVNPFSTAGAGIGTAQISPTTISAGQTSDFAITVSGVSGDTIETIIVVVPTGFSWSRNTADVALGGSGTAGASVAVNQDTIDIHGAAVTNTADERITIRSVTAPDAATSGNFVLATATSGVTPSPIQTQLIVSVTKLVRIIDLHVNDSLGVPAAPFQKGAVVTVSGIITANLSSSQTNLFLQDATGGINIFNYTCFPVFQVGDSVTFTGVIGQYRGTTEVVPDSADWIIHSHGRPLPDPMVLTAADVNATFHTDDCSEPNEGRLVRINGVTYNASGSTLTDATGTTGGYISGSPASLSGRFDIIGILKQFMPASSTPPPYTGNYEVQARVQDDIVIHPGPVFTEAPAEENIQPNSVEIRFQTNSSSVAVVRYGKTASYTDSVAVNSLEVVHTVTLNGLWPATVYHYQVAATDAEGTNQTGDAIFSTASPSGSPDSINVYFNYPTDNSISLGEDAATTNISQKFISRINAAKYSIDVALYSLSGTVGSNVATALINARNRGVRVRMIVEYDNSGTSPMSTMKSNGIPFITDRFDAANAGNGLMHNKFAIFDFRDTSSFTDDWVWSGSWNATDPGTNNDAQNALEIQDKALANAYTLEFNEMWGSGGDTANASSSRFGFRKADNTPHRFNIGGSTVELYFSPSDRTTMHIGQELTSAAYSINIAMLTFTRDDLAQILIEKKAAGDKVRVVLDNDSDQGNEFRTLEDGGVDIRLKGSAVSGYFHHKYAVIDGEKPSADQAVITGSHNWSSAAETSNNENTLIIHSRRITNLYLQEFKARYIEAGGTDDIVLGVRKAGNGVPAQSLLAQNYPNPFNPTTKLQYQVSHDAYVTLKVYDVLGREVLTLVNERQRAGLYSVTFDASGFASGTYFYVLKSGGDLAVKKMILLK